ncbi:MAG: hypothetical protein V1652_01285 [bacterium]
MKEIVLTLWQEMKEVAFLLIPFIKGMFRLAANILDFIAFLIRKIMGMF